MNERYYLMSGETLDYFRRHYLEESRRQYLENIKEGKPVLGLTARYFGIISTRMFNSIADKRQKNSS